MPKTARFALTVSLLSTLFVTGCDFEPRTKKGVPMRNIQAGVQDQVVEEMKVIGQAMTAWHRDKLRQGTSGTPPPCPVISSVDGTTMDRTFEVGKIPPMLWANLQAELVPKYMSELPKTDLWGKGYDFRVNLENLKCPDVLAIRSAGTDRIFGRARYVRSGFEPGDVEQELVWVSGEMIRWPDPKMSKTQ